METLKKDLIDFQMNSLNLISQEEKIYQMEILMNMKKIKAVSSLDSSTHKSSDNKLEETLTREQKEGAFSNFPISEETIKLLKGRG